MQEHFNENYLESKRYPKAVFKGIIENFDKNEIATTAKEYWIRGKINIHGKTKKIRVPASIAKSSERIYLKANFSLNTDDFNITIPFMVRSKISKKVNVAVVATLN